MGKCPECGTWNSLREIKIQNVNSRSKSVNFPSREINTLPKKLHEIKFQEKDRFTTGFAEMDGVLGGGIVPGSVALLAGDPGIGKSTLLLQLALNISKNKKDVLYISGEESEQQIKLRANRLTSLRNDNLLLLSLSNTDAIVNVIDEIKPRLVIVDSIQTMESENLTGLSGSVGQVRYAAMEFIKAAKTKSTVSGRRYHRNSGARI
jgi:DNA repair protein RadA/Sms